jgi:hypothetical protein
LASAPAWLTALLQGLLFAAWMAVGDVIEFHDGSGRTLIAAVVGGLVFAAFMWLAYWRPERVATNEVVGEMSAPQRRAVERAAATGTPPSDPALRTAAVALASYRFARHARRRTGSLVVLSVFLLAVTLELAVDPSVLFVAAMAVFVWTLIWTVRYPTLQRRRIAMLDGSAAVGA